jgi:hypothetical protein
MPRRIDVALAEALRKAGYSWNEIADALSVGFRTPFTRISVSNAVYKARKERRAQEAAS